MDVVANQPELLEAWLRSQGIRHLLRPRAATNDAPDRSGEDTTIDRTMEAVRVRAPRRVGYGCHGDFVIDPAWDRPDFEAALGFVERHDLGRSGFTILRRCPERLLRRVAGAHRAARMGAVRHAHLLWNPKLGPERFFELYCETWRRSVLNLKGQKKWWQWLRHTQPRHWAFTLKALRRTQLLMNPSHYLGEHHLSDRETGGLVPHPGGPTAPHVTAAAPERVDRGRQRKIRFSDEPENAHILSRTRLADRAARTSEARASELVRATEQLETQARNSHENLK